MLQVVRGQRGPRPVVMLLRLLTVVGILLLGLPMPTASAAVGTPTVQGPYEDVAGLTLMASPSNDATPEWLLSDADGLDSLVCWYGEGTPPAVTTWTPCAAGTYAPGTPTGDGTYTLAVAETDGLGTFSAEVLSTYTYDGTAPVISITPLASSADDTPTWPISVTDDSAVTPICSVARGGTAITPVSCTASPTVDLTDDPEGSYVLTVDAFDAAGNGATTATSTFVLDRVVGAVSVTAVPAVDDVATAEFVVSLPTPAAGDPAFTISCVVTGPVPVADPTCSPATTSVTVPLPDNDGDYTLTVTATDGSGSTSDDAATYSYDRQRPVVTFTDGPTGAGQANNLTWTWSTAEAHPTTTASCTLVVDGTPQPAVACTSPSHTFAVSGQSTYGFSVVVTDAAGNDSLPVTSPDTYRRDTVVPVVDATAPASPSQSTAVAFGATVDDPDAVLECRIDRTAPTTAQIAGWGPCPTTDTVLTVDGTYVLSARATDDGQTGTDTASYVLDTTDPAAVTITRSWSSPTGNASLLWGLSPVAAGDTRSCRFTVDGGTPGSWSSCGTSAGFPAGATSGSYLLEVRDVDAALNETITADSAVVLDLDAPAQPVIVSGPSGTAPTAAVTWTFGFPAGTPADPGTGFECQLRGPTPASSFTWQTCATPFPQTLTAQGSYVLDLRAKDAVGNLSALPVTTSATYLLDSVAPGMPDVLGPSGTGRTTGVAWTFSPDPAESTTDDPVRAVCYRRFAGAVVETIDPCTTPVARTLSGEGNHRLDVVLVDAAGNPSPAGLSPTYLLDTVRPVAPTVTAVTGPTPSNTPAITWQWTAETVSAPGRVECRLLRDGVVLGADFGPTASPDPCVSPRSDTGLTDGSYVLEVRVLDAAGNTGFTGASTPYVIDTGAPLAPTFPGAPTGSSQNRNASWAISAESGTSLSCRLVKDGDLSGAFATCTSPFARTGLADGSYVLQAFATDAAQNSGGVGSSPAYVVDNTGPVAPAVSGPSGRDKVRDVRWTWTSAEPTATAECQVLRDGVAFDAWTPCSSPRDVTLPPGENLWQLQVRLTDTLGNLGPAGLSPVYDLKTTLPGMPTVTPPASPSSSRTPVWSFSTEPSTTAECRLTGPAGTGAWTGCGTPTSRDLTGLADGSYVLDVRLTDRHGNTGPAGTAAPYVLDTAAPVAPTLTAQPTGPSQDDTPTWSWTGEAGATSQCQLWRGTTLVTDWTACASPHSPTLPSDGTWHLVVRMRDAALNAGPGTPSADYVLDRVAPAAPVAVGPSSPTNVRSATWTLPAVAAGDSRSCRVTLDGAAFTAFGPCATSVGPVALGADGSYRLEAVDTDTALNASGVGTSTPLVLDTVVPGDPTITSGPSGADDEASVSWAFTVPSDATAQCSLDRDGVTVEGFGSCGSPLVRTLTTDGDHVLRVRAVDAAGNLSGVAVSATYDLDRIDPATPAVSGPSGDDNEPVVRWTFSAEAGAAVVCTLLRGATPVETVSPCTSPVDRTLTPDGTYRLEVVATDAAGNPSPVGSSADYRLDTVRPVAPTVNGFAGETSQTAARWTVTAEAGLVECRLRRDGVTVEDWAGPCALPVDRTLSGDGGYRLDVRVTDVAGNVGDVGSSPLYVLDTAAPTVPVVDGPAGPRNVATVTWGLTVDVGTTEQCRLVLGGAPFEAFTPCTGPVTRTLPSDGDWQLEVVSYDGARNPSVGGLSPVYSLDRVAPAVPTVTGPTGTSNDTTVAYGFAVPADATAACTLRRGGTTAVAAFGCTSPLPRTLGADGSYVLGVVLTDAAGNSSGEGVSPAYLLDTAAPAAPAVTGPTGPSQSRAPSWTITGEAASGSCRVLRGTVVVVDTTACLGTFTADLTGRPDGDHVLEVVTVDAAGNSSAVGSSAPYRLDTTAPLAPVVTGPMGPSPDRAPVFTWTGEAGTTAGCRYVLQDSAPGSFVPCTSPTTAALGTDGSWVLEVALTDAAGNTGPEASSSSYVLDTTAPTAPVVTPPAPVGRDRLPTWGVLAEAGAALECRVTGTGLLRDWTSCTAPVDVDLAGLADGSYVLEVRATDEAGLTSPVGSGTYLLDTLAPAAPVVSVPESGRSTLPSFTFTAEPGTTATCRLSSGTTLIGTPVTCVSPTPVDLIGLADGPYNLNVRLTDAAGNTGFGGLATYVLDTTAPETPVYTARPASPSPDRFPSWTFRVETGSTPVCRLVFPSGAVRDIPACTSPQPVDLGGLADGTYTFSVRAVDAVGNASPAATDAHVLDASAPAVPVVTPQASPARDGTPTWRFTTPAGTTTDCRLTAPSGEVLQDWRVCADSFSTSLFGLPDGPYRLAVRARTATTTSAAGIGSYLYDTTAPDAPVVLSPPTPSTVVVPIFTLSSAEVDATAECRLRLFGGVVDDWRPCDISAAGTQRPVTLPGDGSYAFDVRVTDAAGNTGAVGTASYELVRSAPPAVSVTSPASPGSDTTPTWTFGSPAGTTLECRVTGPAGDVVSLRTCASPFTVVLDGLPDATYALTVHAVNAAGAVGPDTTTSYTLQTSAPAAPTTPVGPSGPSPDRQPRWTFTLPAGTTGVCTVYSDAAPQEPFVVQGCDGAGYVLDLTRAPDATYTLTVEARSESGVLSPKTAPVTYTLLTQVAAPPVFTQEPGSPSSTTTPVWTFTSATGTTQECRVRPIEDAFTACAGSRAPVLSDQPDGTYVLEVRARNAAGTSQAATSAYVLDRSALPLATIVSAPATPGNEPRPTWGLSAPAGYSLECSLSGGAFSPCTTAHTPTLTGDGAHVLAVRLVDSTGRTGAAVRSTYVLDTTLPALPVFVSPLSRTASDPQALWLWRLPADRTDVVECRLRRGTEALLDWAPCGSPFDRDLTTLGQSTYALDLRALDSAGNRSGTVTATYRYDTLPPERPTVTRAPVSTGTGTSPSWTFRAPDSVSTTCSTILGGTVVGSPVACTTSYTMALSGLVPGSYEFAVTVVDAAGNSTTYTLGGYTLASAQNRVDTPVVRPRPPVVIDETPTGPNPGPGPGPGTGGPGGTPGGTPTDPTVDPDRVPTGASVQPRGGPGDPDAPVRPVTGGKKERPSGGGGNALADGLQVPGAIADAVSDTFKKPQLPLALLVIVVLFLLVQNRIDRRDPKLSGAPSLDDDDLAFGPVFRPGGAPA